MRYTLTTAAILASLAVPAAARGQEISSGQQASLSGATIHIYNLSGNVALRRGGGSGVTVRPTAQGADGGQLKFFADRDGDGAVFRVQYPDDMEELAAPEGRGGRTRFGGRTQVRLRSDGTFGGDDDGLPRRNRGRQIDVGREGLRAWADLAVEVPAGARVRVHLVVGEVTVSGVEGDVVVDTWSASAVAENIAGNWLFDSGAGDVTVRGARGTLRIDAGSSSVTVTGMRGEVLEIDNGSGDIEVSDAQVERCDFDTGSGDVRATSLTARRCGADTGSGSVTLDYSGGSIEDLEIDTGSGSVRLTLPPNPDLRIVAEVGSGGINLERSGGMLERRSRDELAVRFGEGRGRVTIDTGSGGVTIR